MLRRIVKRRGEREHTRFNIGPNSHPRKVQRWLRRGGGVLVRDVTPHKHASART